MADKNFVVKNGLEVNTNLIFADKDTNRVGIATTVVSNTLQVNGGIGATSLSITGVSTVNSLKINGRITAGSSLGISGQYLVSTGAGVTWVSPPQVRTSDIQTAGVGAISFNTVYTVGLLDVYINGIKLIDDEFTANDGATVSLNDACFGGETVEFVSYGTGFISAGSTGIAGITVLDEGNPIGGALQITSLNFVGASVTAVGSGLGVTVYIPETSSSGETYWIANVSGIHTTSNVGIGTTNPQTKLEINGVLGFGTFTGIFGGTRTNVRIGDTTTGANLTTGYDNIFMGIGAGNSTTSGKNNNFFGNSAGYNNTIGDHNNFFGDRAGRFSISGFYNNFFGYLAGYCNVSGYHNNFFGERAGYCNSSGSLNNFIGRCAGYRNTTGGCNNFFGSYSGCSNTTGEYNNFFGKCAGRANTTGTNNTFFGREGGFCNTTGCHNNFFGRNSGNCNSTGNFNIFLGSWTGISTSASNKIILGRGGAFNEFFDSPDTTKDTQFAVGIRTSAAPANYWLVGNENFNIGIGTTNPQTKLEINGVLGFGTFLGNYATRTNIRIGDNTTGANLTDGYDNIFMGIGAGNSTTTGNNNNFFGNSAGYNNTTGTNNNFFGDYAGACNTTGGYNNFFGFNAGFSNTTGIGNNFLGHQAGDSNTTGSDNNFFGFNAGQSNISGCHNNFFGNQAGYYNTTGNYNNFFGNQAGRYNTTGCYNNFFGIDAGSSNTTGNYNNFFGLSAGRANTIGNSNTIIGFDAGCCNTSGSYNNFFGDGSGFSNQSGCRNNYLGGFSGISTSASYKVILGWGVNVTNLFDSPDTTKSTQLAIGIRTSAAPANYWLVGNENFNVGIGTTNPTSKLTVGGATSTTQLFVSGVSTSTEGFTSGIGVTNPVQITVSGNVLIFNVVGVGSTSFTLF